MPEFSVQFDLAPFEELDQLALLACQDYNLGNAGNWENRGRYPYFVDFGPWGWGKQGTLPIFC